MDTIQQAVENQRDSMIDLSTTSQFQQKNDSTNTESSIETTLLTIGSRTPIVSHTSDSNVSPSKEFMTLTPIRLPDSYSPTRNPVLLSSRRKLKDTITKNSSLNNYSPTHEMMYQDKFNGISEQLAKLLENLNVIYQKIGYSNSEITMKEKNIFNDLSSLLEKFYGEAELEMKDLSLNNELDQEILNKILIILNDPSGIETIPDLYIRNAVLKQSNKKVPQSPKKPLTLLNKKVTLEKAKLFTFNKYIPKLITFLQYSVTLQKLIISVDNDNIIPDEKINIMIQNLPPLKMIELLLNDLKNLSNTKDRTDSISRLLKEHKNILMDEPHCSDVSTRKIDNIKQTITIYESEVNSRINQNNEMVSEICTLLDELHITAEDELDSHECNILKNGCDILNSVTENSPQTRSNIVISNLHLDSLQLITKKILSIKTNRQYEKRQLLNKCQTLWSILKVPDSQIQNFLAQNEGLSLDVFTNLKIEYENLEKQKKEQIKNLINQSIEEISELWLTLSIEKAHQEEFFRKFNEQYEISTTLEDDEKLLAICNIEMNDLNKKLEVYKPILKLIETFESLQEDEIFLDNSSKDSSRLLSRNSHKILLKEENIRKRLTRHFPKVMSDLSQQLLDAEDAFQRPFLYKNQRMLDIVLDEEEKFVQKFPRSRRISGDRISRIRKERIVSNSSVSSQNTVRSNQSEPVTSTLDKPFRIAKRYNSDGIKRTVTANTTGSKRNINNPDIQRKISPIRYRSNLTESDLMKNSRLLAEESKLPKFHEQPIMNTSRNVSSERQVLVPPTKIVKKPLSTPGNARPKLVRDTSSNISLNKFSTPILQNVSPIVTSEVSCHGIRPTQLFPLSDSKINNIANIKVSRIPSLTKSTTERNMIITTSQLPGKENSRLDNHLLAGQKVQRHIEYRAQDDITARLHSPYREPEHSVYQLSQSPDGKFRLSIQQRQLDNPFDDTSLYEE
ncbi:hypothetical protein C6P45_004739 [Maudiozyma exigua]|uniref:Uncharacterized protein n=1 Tax=Maudiozyma exigua TaxID=34358 RepID=A0A9P7BC76_MAUEX|nr:hypothetical protein C6P45_004739 [Kazachstania exigua]